MDNKIDVQAVARQVLAEISQDTVLCTPVYLPGIASEEEGEIMENAPLVFLWNEDRDTGGFHLSVNSRIVEQYLLKKLPQDHEQFDIVREGIMNAIAQTAQSSVVKLCEELGAYPSQLFGTDKH